MKRQRDGKQTIKYKKIKELIQGGRSKMVIWVAGIPERQRQWGEEAFKEIIQGVPLKFPSIFEKSQWVSNTHWKKKKPKKSAQKHVYISMKF
jgi:hypothetical protein